MLIQRYPGPVDIKERDIVRLREITVTNASQCSFSDLTDKYSHYTVYYTAVVSGTNDVTFRLETSTDNGATWASTGYLNRYASIVTGTTTKAGLAVTGSFPLALRAGTSGNQAISGQVTIYRPGASVRTFIEGFSAHTDFGGAAASLIASGARPVEVTNAIRFVMSSGNIYGRFILYGLRLSR